MLYNRVVEKRGTLYVVATPIGNLGDVSGRALEVLGRVDHIVAEDTREIRKLLFHNRIPVKGRILSYFRGSEERRVAGLIDRLERGCDLALVAARGTPGISDPACLLTGRAHDLGIRVTPVPGACSLSAALSVCGLPTDRVLFLGFLPRRTSKRRRTLESLRDETGLTVIYESPFRLLKTLDDLRELFGPERPAAVCRELTKAFEEIRTGTIAGAIGHFSARPVKGEFIIVVGGRAARKDPAAPGGKQYFNMPARTLPPGKEGRSE